MNQTVNQAKFKPRIFRLPWPSSHNFSTSDCSSRFSDCIQAAVTRTREYLLFTDVTNKFQPSSVTLREVFLMTYIHRSVQLNLTDIFTCTVMSQQQRNLLGSDFVWSLLDPSSKEPKLQIAVQILHRLEKSENTECSLNSCHENGMAASEKTPAEKMMEFCSSIGNSCFALFLFFGFKEEPGNICGLLSNNLHAAAGKCVRIDRSFIENFFRGAKCFVSPATMWQAVVSKQYDEPLTILIKFN